MKNCNKKCIKPYKGLLLIKGSFINYFYEYIIIQYKNMRLCLLLCKMYIFQFMAFKTLGIMPYQTKNMWWYRL